MIEERCEGCNMAKNAERQWYSLRRKTLKENKMKACIHGFFAMDCGDDRCEFCALFNRAKVQKEEEEVKDMVNDWNCEEEVKDDDFDENDLSYDMGWICPICKLGVNPKLDNCPCFGMSRFPNDDF